MIVWWREPGNPDAGLAKLKRRDFPTRTAGAGGYVSRKLDLRYDGKEADPQ